MILPTDIRETQKAFDNMLDWEKKDFIIKNCTKWLDDIILEYGLKDSAIADADIDDLIENKDVDEILNRLDDSDITEYMLRQWTADDLVYHFNTKDILEALPLNEITDFVKIHQEN